MTARSSSIKRRVYSSFFALAFGAALFSCTESRGLVLRIRDWGSAEVYAETPVREGDVLFFGWTHSLEKIPWNEYYHVGGDGSLILDAITFTAFGAGIPENKGRVCYVKDGVIHMEQIDQGFSELVWLNSRFTGDIAVNGVTLTGGALLPDHVRLKLSIEDPKKQKE